MLTKSLLGDVDLKLIGLRTVLMSSSHNLLLLLVLAVSNCSELRRLKKLKLTEEKQTKADMRYFLQGNEGGRMVVTIEIHLQLIWSFCCCR